MKNRCEIKLMAHALECPLMALVLAKVHEAQKLMFDLRMRTHIC